MTFTFLTTTEPTLSVIGPDQYREVEIYVQAPGLVMKVPVDTYSTPTAAALQSLLTKVSSAMKQYNCQPMHSFKRYESLLKADMWRKGLSMGH